MFRRLACVVLALLVPCLANAEDDGALRMSYIDTPDLRLVWFEPLGFLAPHVIRTYTNSLKWHRQMLGWVPTDRTTVVLKDWSDYGNAAAMSTPRNFLAYDVAPLSLPNSSVWLRNAGGYVSGNPDISISNFYLGGFGNNYVDSREIKRYRERYSYPGFGIDAISGQSFVWPMLEWNITPYVFESVGTPAFHLACMCSAVFASALWTDVESSSRRKNYANVGAQVDFDVTVLHWYPMTLSVGYAIGFGDGRRSNGEWMASLKIM